MKISLYCSVGNEKRPFSRLLEQVAAAEGFLKGSLGKSTQLLITVQHGHTPPIEADWKFCQFLSYEAHVRQLESADIVLGHAGAGLLTDAINAGKRPFLLPRKQSLREHLNDHQEQIFSFGVEQKLCYGFETLSSDETITALANTGSDFLSQTKHLNYSELSDVVLDRINVFGQS
jgi:UDP-N-acetylglucosamine transferase subunit ALG13